MAPSSLLTGPGSADVDARVFFFGGRDLLGFAAVRPYAGSMTCFAPSAAVAATVLALSLGAAAPLSAQTDGVWREDLLALGGYDPATVGGYWDAGYDFDFTLYCVPTSPAMAMHFGSVHTAPSPDLGVFSVQIGDRRFPIPWEMTTEQMGFLSGHYPTAPLPEPWPDQHAFIQLLLDGNALLIMEGDSIDDPQARVFAAADPAPGHVIFQALSRACGSGEVTPQAAPRPAPAPEAPGPSPWVLGAGTELWDGLTAYAPSDNGDARGFVHCGANGQAEFVLRVARVEAPAGTNFGAVFIGTEVFEITAGSLQGAYVFAAPPAMVRAMMTGPTMSIDSLLATYHPGESALTFDLHGAAPVLEQALTPCAATALP